MDNTVVVLIVLGAALIVAVVALILYKPTAKSDQPPSLSSKRLKRLYEEQYGASPDFEGEYLRERKRKRDRQSALLDAAGFPLHGDPEPLVKGIISVLGRPFRRR